LTAVQLEQWDLLGDGSSGASIAVYSLPSLSTTFQIWTSFVSLRSTPPSACHGTRHLTQWMRTEMSGGRERGRRPSRGSLLEHDDDADEGGPEGDARADGERDEMGQLDGYEMRHPR
jgi:hypothetical protein